MKPEEIITTKTLTELIDSAKARLRDLKFRITNFRPGGVFYTLLECGYQAVADLYDLLKQVATQMYLDTATGTWLELKAAEYNVFRNQALKTKGNVIMGRNADGGNVVIPAGSIVATPVNRLGERYQYRVTSQVVLEAGMLEVEVPVEAEFAGAKYNVGTGQITELVTFIPGINYVRNGDDWITREGADTESDNSLRARAKAAWNRLSYGGTKAAYIAWGLEVPGVTAVRVNDQHPRGQGTVDVIITSSAGIPSSELVSQVQAYIDERRPLCADVLVMGPEPLPVDFIVTLYVAKDYGDTSGISAAAADIIDIMFRYGDTEYPEIRKASPETGLTRAQVFSNLMTIPDVVNINLAAPAADVSITSNQLAVKGNVNISVVKP